jgi:uncharacterized integral membrane protein
MATRLEDRPLAGRPQERSLGGLIGDLAHETTTLLRKEVELAKVEMSEKIDKIQTAVVSMAAGGAVLYAGFLVFLLFLVIAVDAVLDNWIATDWLAPLIVSAIVLGAGYFMLKAGQKRFEGNALMPRRTLRSLQRDASFMQREGDATQAAMRGEPVRTRPLAEEVRDGYQ